MAQDKGAEEHDGLLIQGADGSLWFMRDDANAPVRVPEEVVRRIKELQEEDGPQFSGLSPRALAILREEFPGLGWWGALFWRTTRLRR